MKYFRRKFRRTRRFKRRRITKRRMIGRMMRRYAKPEVKWVETFGRYEVSADTVNSRALITQVQQGVQLHQRVGNRIKSLWMTVEWDISVARDFSTVANQNKTQFVYPIRVLIVSPTVDNVEFLAYINTDFSRGGAWDSNIGTLYYDYIHPVVNPYIIDNPATIDAQPLGAGGNPYAIVKKKKYFKFPRSINFRPGVADIADAKDVLYLIIAHLSTSDEFQRITVGYRAKMSYVDT